MVSVVNGSGLGLFTSRGSTGSAGLGQTREQVFVNSTTGNLVIQNVDEFLTATGRDLGITRTYNSLGAIDGDNNDGWRIGIHRSLAITAGTSIVKTFGDGAQVTYLYNSGTGEYVSTEGEGAHDKIVASGATWIWTDGSERNTETYDSGGKITNLKDADGNTFSFQYGSGVTANQITQISTTSPAIDGGDSSVTNVFLDYFAGTKNLQQIRVVRNSVVQTLTSYTYDGQGRLWTVTVDLTPDTALTTADSYVTTYGYEGTSLRVGSITQRAAGSANVTATVGFTYENLNGDYRLKTYTDGENHTTTFTYSSVSAGGGSSTTLPANSGVLNTTETQNVPTGYTLNPSAVSTTDTQTTSTPYNVINSQITTGATQTDTYNRNNAALSTTDTQTTTTPYNVNNAQLTTSATQTDSYNRNNAALSTTDTQTTTTNYNVNSAQLTTNATQTTSYNRNDAALSTTDTQTTTTNYNVNSAQLTTNATQTTSYNRNNAALSTTDTTTTTNSYALNSGALTTPAGGGVWGTATLLDPLPPSLWFIAPAPEIAFDANGNGFAIWSQADVTLNSVNLVAARYTKATNSWGAPTVLATVVNTSVNAATLLASLAVDTAGNALVGWLDGFVTGAGKARRFDVATGVWGAATTFVSKLLTKPMVAISGANAAILYTSTSGLSTNLFASRLSGSSWVAGVALEAITTSVTSSALAIDNQGNINVVFAQGTAINRNRYTASSNTWSGSQSLAAVAGANVNVALDNNGNGFAVWTSLTDVMMSRYTRSTNTWTTPAAIDGLATTASAARLAVDGAGNAVVGWVQDDGTGASVITKIYNAATSTWGALTAVENTTQPASSQAGDLSVAISGSYAAASWMQYNNAWNIHGAVYNGTAWASAANLEGAALDSRTPRIAIDSTGGATAVWQNDDGLSYFNRFAPGGSGTPYYTVPAGASWQSVANALYGINSAAAGTALQAVMGNPALTTGVQLTGWPATLSVTTTTTVTVPAYYNVPAGATWQSIANAVYGINSAAAGTALQTAMGNPTLSTGLHLTGFAATLSVTTTLPAHYLVPSGATWQSIANTLYGVNSAAAGTALQTALGNPSIAAGQRLYNIPAQLAVTATTTVTVPAYYNVPAGATWQSIANAVYGINSAAAGTALQTAMGNPTLSTGLHLTGFPATLSVTTTLPAHYLVPSSATWQSIANTLYGVNNAAAGTALQTALGNPSIAAGQRLYNIPAQLAVTTTTTVTVPAYYNVPAGATWQSIANAVYGINSAAAGSALQTAMASPTLSTGLHLTGFPATLSVTTTLPAHYLVPAGATWQSIANTLYGVNSTAAGTALQTALGNPSIASGQRLYNIPGTLSVTTTSTVTVPPYYTIPAGASWQSIANTVYGINSAAAGSALQTAMGNPALTAGNRLTNFPATISIVTNLAPHYLVPAGATWQSVANTLYGVNNAAAGTALQTALGNPALTAGTRLYNIPNSITVTTTSTITVPAYYVIPSSPSWQAIANTLYGINSAAAGSALQTVLGNPALTPGNRLTNLPATLTVVTQQTITVPPYYIVPAGATWISITQAIYNTSVSEAVAALQAATGNPALTTNLHLTVPANLTYSTATAVTANVNNGALQNTDIQVIGHGDPLNTSQLSTTQQVMVDTTFLVQNGQFQTTEMVPQSTDYAVNSGQILTTELQTRQFNLQANQLTTPPVGWIASAAVAGSTATVTNMQVKFDSAGNGLAVWSVGTDFRWARYSGATKTWGAAQSTFDNRTDTIDGFSLAMDSNGNAVVGWIQGPLGVNNQLISPVLASMFNASAGTWSSPTSIGSTYRGNSISAAIRGGIAAVSYAAAPFFLNDNSSIHMYAARYNGSSWISGIEIGQGYTDGTGISRNAVGIDSSGSIHVVWTESSQSLGGGTFSRRFNGSSWLATQTITTSGGGWDVFGGFSAAGDGVIAVQNQVWRFVKSTGVWTQQSPTLTDALPRVDVDDAGNAIIGYMNGSTFNVLTFNGSSWSSATSLSSTAQNGSGSVAVRNGKFVAGWSQANNAFSSANEGSGWGTASPAGTSAGGYQRSAVGIDSTGDMHLVWGRGTGNGTTYDVMTSRYLSTANAIPYLTLDGDPNWQEIAYLLYTENRPEAGAALQAAMGNPTLVANTRLTGFPTSITYAANFPASEPYYLIPGGWSMQQVAQALYAPSGVTLSSPEAGNALQALITAGTVIQSGNRLTHLPATLRVTVMVSQATAPYYVVVTSDWQAIAATLYNLNSTDAGNALRTAMGNASPPPVGQRLLKSALPASIVVPILTTQNVPAYYLVPQAASWQSIANTLYGATAPEAGAALGAFMTALTPSIPTPPLGGQLRGMPGTLSYNTTQTITVPYYYLVVGGDSWALVTQKVYGSNDPAAVAALQAAMAAQTPPVTTLAVGAHLTMPASISYTATIGGATVYQQTDVVDTLGLTTTYKATVQGLLVSTLSPTINGARIETRYDYDTTGNITAITYDPGGLNRVTAMTYDTNGNMKSSRDSAGNTVTRNYDANNQIVSETIYLVPDPDGFGGQSAGTPLTTNYVYDSENHLRYVVSADGRVTEHNYFNAGTRKYTRSYGGNYPAPGYTGAYTLTALNSWVTNRTPVEITEYAYDFRGNLASTKRYETTDTSGNGTGNQSITNYVYDQRGNLLNVIDPRGTGTPDVNDYKTTYVYDGLGRMTQVVEWLASNDSRTTTTLYQDTINSVKVTLNSTLQPLGRVTTTVYDRSGAIVSVANADTAGTSFGSTVFAYDVDNRLRMVTDPMNVRSYVLYDTLGRKSGEVDAEGRLTRFVYNRAGQPIKAVRYSNALSSTALATLVTGGLPANVTVDSLVATLTLDATKDQTTRNVYDKAGRLVYAIDAGGFVTQNFYDGASRVTDVVSFATAVSIAASVDELDVSAVNVSSSADDRRQRNFYNGDGMLLGTLDGAGYLVEFVYDLFGHLQKQTGYAAPTTAANRLTGSLDTLRLSADDDPTHDINSYFYYDAQGRNTGVLNGEGYFTETKYDLAGNVSQKIRYEKQAAYNADLATVRAAATGAKNQVTGYGYDGAGRLTSTTNFEGTPSSTTYNVYDEVTSATLFDRTMQKRYNAMGWVTQELSGEGSAQITGGMTPGQIDAVWTQWAITHTYDNAGHRKSTTDQYGNKSWFYYDVDGRVRYTVRDLGNGTGEVSEAKYNALGQLTDTIAYTGRIAMAGIAGGLVDSAITSAVNAVANASSDAHSYLTYKQTGSVASQRNQEGAQTDYTYNAFGQVSNKFEKISSSITAEHRYTYDTRGLLKNTGWDPTGINRTETNVYDAFGRLTSVTDQDNRQRRTDYDRLGRAVATHGGIMGEDARFDYDAFGRVLYAHDGYDKITSYTYDDSLKSVIMTTPEGVTVTTLHYATGETKSVTDSDGRVTSYEYNKDGQLTRTSDGLGNLETRTYDRAGRQDTSLDGLGVITRFAYDAASRLFTRTQNEGGLNLQTVYAYDGQGRITRVTEPNGRITDTTYYTDGRVKQLAVDPSGLNLRTFFEYDLAGNTVKVTEGYGTTQARITSYLFDKLGRRYEEIADPGALNLRTQYKYDANGNVTRKIDANGNSTWYIYDADNRLKSTIDALGGVTSRYYDLNSRLIYTYQYSTPISVAAFGDVVTTISPTTNAYDRLNCFLYDRDGRLVYQIDAGGAVTERTYDASGNVTRTLRYSRAVPISGYSTLAAVAAALGTAGNTAGTPTGTDHVTWTAYDARSRVAFSVNASGGVVRFTYDLANNLLETRQYASQYTNASKTFASLNSWATGAIDTNVLNRVTRHRYDGAGREVYNINALGGVSEYTYDGIGNVTRTLLYANALLPADLVDTFTQITQSLNNRGNTAGTVRAGFDRVRWSAYDAAGRQVYDVDALGGVARSSYDATNLVTETREFAQAYTGAAKDKASLDAWVAGGTVNTDSANRVSRLWYDTAGRARFKLNSEGYLSETRYDNVASTTRDIAYMAAPAAASFTAGTTTANVVSIANGIASAANDRTTLTALDKLGRVQRVTDAYGNYQEFTYDTLGNKRSYRNQAGAVWDYDYDLMGRVTYEYTPAVEAYTVSGNETSLTLSAPANARITTKIEYDAFGNVWKRTEALGTLVARTTEYIYDSLGRQTRTNLPAVSYYNKAADDINRNGLAVVRVETAAQPLYTETTYDTLGDAVVNRDVAGSFSYRVYDQLGRAKFEVDAEGYVSQHNFDRFGNETGLLRYAGLYTGTMNGTAIAFNTFAVPGTNAADRLVTKTYDTLNHLTSEFLPSVYWYSIDKVGGSPVSATPTTNYFYNAFGEVYRKTVLVSIDGGGTGTFANTYLYRDHIGRVIAEVDPTNYLTATEYDAVGNVKRHVEYAAALSSPANYATPTSTTPQIAPASAIGFDRDTTYSFDLLNRLKTETRVKVSYSTVNTGVPTAQTATRTYKDVSTTYDYDAVGNRTVTTNNETNGKVYEYYDVLGRTVAIVDVSRDIGNPQVQTLRMPLITFKRDAFGNVLQQTRFANGLTSIPANGVPAVTSDPVKDEVTTTQYDSLGRTVHVEDATGADLQYSYTARGDLAKEWQLVKTVDGVNEALVTLHEYDKLGHERFTTRPLLLANGSDVTTNLLAKAEQRYNAFGEMTWRTRYDGSQAAPVTANEVFAYDNAGRLYRTNAGDGVYHIFLYDLAGRQTAEFHSAGRQGAAVGTLGTDLSNYSDLTVAPSGSVIRTENGFDLAGRLTSQKLPSFSSITDLTDSLGVSVAIGPMNLPNDPNFGYVFNKANPAGFIYDEYLYWDPYAVRGTSAPGNGGGHNRDGIDGTYNMLKTNAQYLYWSDPQNVLGETSQTFEYRLAGTNNAWIPITVDKVFGTPGRMLGVDVRSLANNTYEYKISYSRPGDSAPFAILRGNMTNPAAAGATVTDTTASYLGATVTLSPTTSQTNDRWGNTLSSTDALGKTTNYRYDQNSQLMESAAPSISVTQVSSTTGQITTTTLRPTSENHYNSLGRLIAKKDANGNVSSATVNAASQTISEMNADGTIKKHQYDLFGNRVVDADELNNQTRYTYDQRNLQTRVEHGLVAGDITTVAPINIVSSNYQYDEAGRRILDQDAGYNVSYWYDLHGNVRKRNTPMGNQVVYTYDVNDQKLSETDALGGKKDWTYDYFGHVLTHHELGYVFATGTQSSPTSSYINGILHNYTYDNAGLLVREISDAGKRATYSYDAAGHVTNIVEDGVDTGNFGRITVARTTNFTYDIAGRHVRERTTVDNVLEQNATIKYDAAGRMVQVWDVGAGVTLDYDAAGNQTHLFSWSNSSNGAYTEHYLIQWPNPPSSDIMGTHDFQRVSNGWYTGLHTADAVGDDTWYQYDSMNRLKISRGWNLSGFVSADTASTGKRSNEFTYYANGDRKSQRNWGDVYQLSGSNYSIGTGASLEEYTYDGMHRLTGTKKDNIVTGVFGYDGASHQTSATTYTITGSNKYLRRDDTTGYDSDGKQLYQFTFQNDATNGATKLTTRVDFGASTRQISYDGSGNNPYAYYSPGTDLVGNVRSYTVKTYDTTNGTLKYTNTYNNDYVTGEGYLLGHQHLQGNPSGPGSGAVPSDSYQSYDLNGNLVFTQDSLNWVRNRAFTYDAAGNMLGTLYQTAATAGNTATSFATAFAASTDVYWTRNFFANNKNIGSIDTSTAPGPQNTVHIAWKFNIADGGVRPTDQVSFSQVITQSGETLRKVALRVYGDSALWYVLAEENAYTDPDAILAEGIALRVPSQLVNMRNSSEVFKPFNAAQAVGDTSPTSYFATNPEFKEHHCSSLAMIVAAIVYVVLSIWLPGSGMAIFEGTGWVSAAATAAVATAGSQLAVIAIDGGKFDWTAVAIAAVTAGITRGLKIDTLGAMASEAVKTGHYATAFGYGALNSALNNAVSQGVNIVAGRQDSFNWREVAISGISGGASTVAGGYVAENMKGVSTQTANMTRSFIGGVTDQVVRVAAGGKFEVVGILSNVFGQAIGNGLVSLSRPKNPFTGIGMADPMKLDVDIDAALHELDAQAPRFESDAAEAAETGAVANGGAPGESTADSEAMEEITVTGHKPLLFAANDPSHTGMWSGILRFFEMDQKSKADRVFKGGVNGSLRQYFEADKILGSDLSNTTLVDAFSDLNGIGYPNKLRTFSHALEAIGINQSNYNEAAAYLVLDGMTPSDVDQDLRERLGPGFRQQLDESPELQQFFADRVAGAEPGQLINISDFWNSAVQDATMRVYHDPGAVFFRDVVDHGGLWQGTVPGLSKLWGKVNLNAILANDDLAPPALREYAKTSNITELVTTVASALLPVKSVFARMGSVGAMEGRIGINALKETLIGMALNSAKGVKGTTFEGLFFERFANLGFKKFGEGLNATLQKLAVTLPNGRQIRFVPEMLRIGNETLMRGVTEVKAWDVVSMGPQIMGEAQLAMKMKVPYNLVVGPNAQVYQAVIDVTRKTGGGVYMFNPATGALKKWW